VTQQQPSTILNEFGISLPIEITNHASVIYMFSLRLTERDFLSAARKTFLQRHRRTLTFISVGTVAFLAAAAATVTGLFDRSNMAYLPHGFMIGIGIPLGLASIGTGIAFFVSLSRMIRTEFNQRKDAGLLTSVTVTEGGLIFESELGKGQFPWGHVHDWNETNTHILIYQSDWGYYIFPKSAIDDQRDLELLRRCLSGILVAPKGPRSSATP
jgi:hypothetical protein